MRREYYFDPIETFLDKSPQQILGELFQNSLDGGSVETTQRDAWMEQISILHGHLNVYRGRGAVFFEYSIPRLGKRIDVVAINRRRDLRTGIQSRRARVHRLRDRS